MICTAAAIAWMLGAMPARGTVVTVPRTQLAMYTKAKQDKAKACAAKYGIQWRIDESR